MAHPIDLADALEKWAKSAHTRDLYAGATSLSETLAKAAAAIRDLSAKLEAAEAERDAALDALEPFSIMAGVLFAMNYELSDDVFSIKAKHGEVAMTFEAFLNAHAAARQKGGE